VPDLYVGFDNFEELSAIVTLVAHGGNTMTTVTALTIGFWIGANLGFLLGGFVCLWGRVV
jgi:hypothetical protein